MVISVPVNSTAEVSREKESKTRHNVKNFYLKLFKCIVRPFGFSNQEFFRIAKLHESIILLFNQQMVYKKQVVIVDLAA